MALNSFLDLKVAKFTIGTNTKMTGNLHNEDALIARISEGDEKAFSQFHREFYLTFLYYTNAILKNMQESESIVAATLEKFWILKANFKGKGLSDVRAYMYVTCRNSAYNFLKYGGGQARKNEILTADVGSLLKNEIPVDDIESAIIKAELYQEMYDQIDRLSPRQRTILGLILQGKSHKEIAEDLNLKEGAIRILKFKAILTLRKQLLQKRLLSAAVVLIAQLSPLMLNISQIGLLIP